MNEKLKKDPETEPEIEPEVDPSIEDEIEKAAQNIEKKLDLKGLREKIDTLIGRDRHEIVGKIFGTGDVQKNVDSLTASEKIVGFFSSLVNGDRIALKALSEGVAADGGYLVPDEFRAELVRDLNEPTRMRAMVRVIPMVRDVMRIPKLGSRPTLRWTSENAAKSTTTADFEEKVLTAYKVAAILYASDELIEDAVDFNVVQLIIQLFSEAIAEEEDRVITAGSGTGQPTGLMNCTIGSVACGGNLSFDDIINLIYLLPAKYRINASFLCHNTNIRELRKVKDSQNRYIWQEAIAPGQPDTIMGYPIYENNHLSEARIYFGDYKKAYWLGDKGQISVTISREAGEAWEHDQVGIRVVERLAGNCVLENAVRYLTSIP
jgi:HK97 family phage major capsid protein